MGARHVEEICRELVAGAMPGSTPAAAVSNATRDEQRSVRTCLDNLAQDMEAAGIESPCILIVGEIADLAPAQGAASHRRQAGAGRRMVR